MIKPSNIQSLTKLILRDYHSLLGLLSHGTRSEIEECFMTLSVNLTQYIATVNNELAKVLQDSQEQEQHKVVDLAFKKIGQFGLNKGFNALRALTLYGITQGSSDLNSVNSSSFHEKDLFLKLSKRLDIREEEWLMYYNNLITHLKNPETAVKALKILGIQFTELSNIILPPDQLEIQGESVPGELREKPYILIDKVGMLIELLLSKGLHLGDINVFIGTINRYSSRRDSYVAVVIQKLGNQGKTILVNNGYGQATFIVDSILDKNILTGFGKEQLMKLGIVDRVIFILGEEENWKAVVGDLLGETSSIQKKKEKKKGSWLSFFQPKRDEGIQEKVIDDIDEFVKIIDENGGVSRRFMSSHSYIERAKEYNKTYSITGKILEKVQSVLKRFISEVVSSSTVVKVNGESVNLFNYMASGEVAKKIIEKYKEEKRKLTVEEVVKILELEKGVSDPEEILKIMKTYGGLNEWLRSHSFYKNKAKEYNKNNRKEGRMLETMASMIANFIGETTNKVTIEFDGDIKILSYCFNNSEVAKKIIEKYNEEKRKLTVEEVVKILELEKGISDPEEILKIMKTYGGLNEWLRSHSFYKNKATKYNQTYGKDGKMFVKMRSMVSKFIADVDYGTNALINGELVSLFDYIGTSGEVAKKIIEKYKEEKRKLTVEEVVRILEQLEKIISDPEEILTIMERNGGLNEWMYSTLSYTKKALEYNKTHGTIGNMSETLSTILVKFIAPINSRTQVEVNGGFVVLRNNLNSGEVAKKIIEKYKEEKRRLTLQEAIKIIENGG